MATAGSSTRPSAALVAMAALLGAALVVLAATPAGASQFNFYRGENCTGGISLSCFDGYCCNVPAGGASSFEFHYVTNFNADLYDGSNCFGDYTTVGNELQCTNGVYFRSVRVTGGQAYPLRMPTDEQ